MSAEEDEADGELPFRQLAQALPIPCWISDNDGRILWVNDAWLDYTGKDSAALEREGLAVIHDPETLPAVREKWAETRAAGQPAEMIFPIRGRDGSFRPFHTRVVPLRDSRGVLTRWFGTNVDISREAAAEMRAASTEASLRENEARLRLATEAAGVGVWEWRLDTNEMIYSDRAKAICGFELDGAVTYEMVVAVTHPDDFPITSAQAARAIDPQIRDHSSYEYRIVRPDGVTRWVTASGEAVFQPGPDGDLIATRYVGVLSDVTERRLAQDAVRESEHQLQMALRAGRMAAWRIDPDGRLAPNPELNLLAGLPADAEPTLTDLAENYLPGELDRIRKAAEAARARGDRYFEIEYRYRRPDGDIRWFTARAEALAGEGGAPAGVVGVVMDITERKADEERLLILTREVDHRANNLMTVVEGIVALSRAGNADELRDVLRGRIHALARAHQLLAETRWKGAQLRRLVEEELSPFVLGEASPRVHADGPDISLPPSSAQSLAMALHELATNAVKHGALSTDTGRVALTWRAVNDAVLEICWEETGGPVVRPPIRRGLGTSMIGRTFSTSSGGSARMEWRKEGLFCELTMPVTAQ